MRSCPDQTVRPALSHHAIIFARQELQGSVRSKMYDRIRTKFFPYIMVKCLICLRWFLIPVMIAFHDIRLAATFLPQRL